MVLSQRDSPKTYREVYASFHPSDRQILDRHGDPLDTIRVDFKQRRLSWIPLERIAPSLLEAVLHAEDRRFFSHIGVDPLAIGRAIISRVRDGNRQGASTISAQLADLIAPRKRARASFWQKIAQFESALRIDAQWTKREQLEAYLNLVPFRGELRGVHAASISFFKKIPAHLTLEESLVLASLIRSPEAVKLHVLSRATSLGDSLKWKVDGEHLTRALTGVFEPTSFRSPTSGGAPHVARLVSDKADGDGIVTTTIDSSLQRFVLSQLRSHLAPLIAQRVGDGAVIVLHNRTGEVRAYVGNQGQPSSARFVDGVRAPREAGSTLKPFVYATALDQEIMTAETLLDDSPFEIDIGGAVYRPRNYGMHYHGTVSVRTALASSLNVPAVRTLTLVGGNNVFSMLTRAGVSLRFDSEHYGPSLALGTPSVSLWELAAAYRSIANGGVWSNPTLLSSSDRIAQRVMSEDTAEIIADILADPIARSATFGISSPLAAPGHASVKTGTSRDMKDNWCIGFNSEYTVGVWVGNFAGTPMKDVTGVTGAAPLWASIMKELMDVGALAQGEVTVAKQPTIVAPTIPRIIQPVSGTVVSLDYDVPADLQRVLLASRAPNPLLEWRVDGSTVGTGAEVYWEPTKGKRTIELLSRGQTTDSAVIYVK